jgi:hypothetical protein
MLNLENVKENIDELVNKYHICVSNNNYLLDGDLEELFYDSNIDVGETIYKAKDWEYGEDGWLIGCEDGDYIEAIELIQNGKTYLCKVFSDRCGDGLDYTLALSHMLRVGKDSKKDSHMNIDMDFIKEEIENQVIDKLGNMCDSEITGELHDFLLDKTEPICKCVYEILDNNECVNCGEFFFLSAFNGFDDDLILDWDYINELEGEEREKRIQSDILYNYDALWMTAIHKAFPNNTTNTQCGYGEMELIV